MRLLYFQSESQQVGAYVLYVGLGLGLGAKIKATPQGAQAVLEIANWVGKPKLKTGTIELALPRRKIPKISLGIVKTDEWFSMAELHEARGSVSSAGIGIGIGVRVLAAMAFKGEKILRVIKNSIRRNRGR